MVFPTGGNLSDAIVAEVLKAAAVPNPQTGLGQMSASAVSQQRRLRDELASAVV